MQRRVMSHNAKRFPTALRQSFIEAREKSGCPAETKRPRRKYRRRPKNLLNEYNRRQRSFIWLETHIWHAKRFHMISKWGYKLPHYPNDKSYRACYRASTQHCLLQDISYYICIEINGDASNILNGLNHLTDPRCGLTFGAKYVLNGAREGSTMIYCKDKYPYGVIGTVNFIWKSPLSLSVNSNLSNLPSSELRTLWIWIHPAFYNNFLHQIIDVFDLIKCKDVNCDSDSDSDNEIEMGTNSDKGNKSNLENLTTKISKNKVVKYISNTFSDVCVIELKDTINRLRLTGPLSQSILTDAFVPLDPDDLDSLLSKDVGWIHDYYNECHGEEIVKRKQELWLKMKKHISDPGNLPCKMILPLIIRDPRFTLPDKRRKVITDTEGTDEHILEPLNTEFLSDNPLWNRSIRDKVTNCKLSTNDISLLQSKQLIPGTIDDIAADHLQDSKFYLPVLIIQNSKYTASQSDRRMKGVGHGWDVVLPAGWTMPVWLALVWRGARVGGIREQASLYNESGIAPLVTPDSEAGLIDNEEAKLSMTEKHFRKPPTKRANFIKLGITSPFHYSWKELLRDWNESCSVPSCFFVLRDRALLENINLMKKSLSGSKGNFNVNNYESDKENMLIGINIKVYGRGNLSDHSIVCLPSKEDLQLLIKKTNERPVELPHADPNARERSDIQKNHLRLLKQLKKKRKKLKINKDDNYKFIKQMSDEIVKHKEKKMKELWLPSNTLTISIKDSCSRRIMGYVVSGGYSFTQSCCTGIAYVTLTSLFELYHQQQSNLFEDKLNFNKKLPFILIRMPSTYQYSFATFEIINNFVS
ncbi:POP1 ribonuclease P/MRP subunit isoform X2 [Lycorma delicatula]